MPLQGISSFAFGRMEISSRVFTSDLLILPDGRILDNWRRRSGHQLSLRDLGPIMGENPDLIIIGTGVHGRMKPDPGLENQLSELGTGLKIMATDRAAAFFNSQLPPAGGKKIAAGFHLTC